MKPQADYTRTKTSAKVAPKKVPSLHIVPPVHGMSGDGAMHPPRPVRSVGDGRTDVDFQSRKRGSADPVRIVVVDDHRFMRELISGMLARQSGRYKVLAEYGDATTAIEACQRLSPDLLILDINLPDVCGIDAVPEIKKIAPHTRILLCTAFVSDERVVDALRSGADGFIEKTNTWKDFVEAIEHVSQGEHYFRTQSTPALTHSTAPRSAVGRAVTDVPLTRREIEVLNLVAQGNTSKEIAAKLSISVGTIDTHRNNIMRKLKLRNVAELVVYAFRAGIIQVQGL